jgi:hypothetical protein
MAAAVESRGRPGVDRLDAGGDDDPHLAADLGASADPGGLDLDDLGGDVGGAGEAVAGEGPGDRGGCASRRAGATPALGLPAREVPGVARRLVRARARGRRERRERRERRGREVRWVRRIGGELMLGDPGWIRP